MRLPYPARVASLVALAAGVVGLITLAASPGAGTQTAGAAPATIDHWTAVARGRYAAEVRGPVAHRQLHRVAADPALLRALQSGKASATQAYVKRQFKNVWYHWHVSRLRIWQGSKLIVDEGVPFCVDGPKLTLRAGGRTVGTLQVSIQDEIGVVRLMRHVSPVDVVIRGVGSAHVRSSLPAAAKAKLPSSGQATIAGRRYLVRSFHQTALGGEPVTVSILQKG